jgi:hypothetical protein
MFPFSHMAWDAVEGFPNCWLDLPSPSESGSGTRSSQSPASRPGRMHTSHLAVSNAAADCRASAQAVPLPPSGSRFQTHWYLHLLLIRRRKATDQEPFFRSLTSFSMPENGGAITVSTAAVPSPPVVTTIEVGPLTSPPSS